MSLESKAKTLREWMMEDMNYDLDTELIRLEDAEKDGDERVADVVWRMVVLENNVKELEARLEQAKELVDSMLDDCSTNDVELYQNLREARKVLERPTLEKLVEGREA